MSWENTLRRSAGLLGSALLAVAVASAFAGQDMSPRLGKDLSGVLRVEASAYAWSPDGKRLAYSDGRNILIGGAPNFEQARRVVDKSTSDIAWSPDGNELGFVGPRGGDSTGNNTIWIVSDDGSGLRDLLRTAKPAYKGPQISYPMISGWLGTREIAFVQHCGTACSFLKEVDYAGTAVRGFCAGRGEFFWSPDHTRAVAQDDNLGRPGWMGLVGAGQSSDSLESAAFCEYPISGCFVGEPPPGGILTPDKERYTFDNWNSDSRNVLYTGTSCMDDPAEGGDLFTWDVIGNVRKVVLSNAGYGAWSPDRTKIAFTLFGVPTYKNGILTGGSGRLEPAPQVYVGDWNSRESRVTNIVALCPAPRRGPGFVMSSDIEHPIWSPRSDRLIVRNADKDLVLFSADGKKKTLLLEGWKGSRAESYVARGEARWSPDGNWIALLVGEEQPIPAVTTALPTPQSADANAQDAGSTVHAAGRWRSTAPSAQPPLPTFTQVLYVIANPKL